MYNVYTCEDHDTQLKKCCDKAQKIGWFEEFQAYGRLLKG